MSGGPPKQSGGVSIWQAAIRCRCPRCGKGPLFRGLLKVRDRCDTCGLDLREIDMGDGPAVLVILLLGTLIVGLAFWVEFHFEPPLWVHVVLWPIVTLPLAIAMIRPLKSAMVAQQYRTQAAETES